MTTSDFNELVSKHSRKLFVYAIQILRNQEEAEDAVQEVFIKLWNLHRKTEEYTSIEALLVKMTKNYCIDQLRKRKYIDYDDHIDYYLSGGTNPSPQEEMERKETSDLLNGIIGQLPEFHRKIIQLREVDGYSYEEISKKTNQNINALRVTLSRARKNIRDEYLKHHDEDRRT